MAKGFYYKVSLKAFDLSDGQVEKIRDYVREKVRDASPYDSGQLKGSLKTLYDKQTKILMVYSRLWYSGYVEGGNVNYNYHKHKIGNALRSMGLKTGSLGFF